MSQTPDAIFHMTLSDDWSAARAQGEYLQSTRDLTLAQVGFIHCSFAHQLAKVANRIYADTAELIVLEIDPELLTAPLKVEPGEPGGEEFPHIYGPLNTGAVLDDFWWERGEDGIWHRPPVLA